ncbi:hypothetical protein [Macromonas nakdongensis]|uniref:hypothetical protein n=1 Tax=Macromonas nakdongensis TaxID=1843082 RepID=UPI000C324C2C|nr:hypothetical protein [Macromonas nakdongensis]
MAIELADEHDPSLIVCELLHVIANTLGDSRRGWMCHGDEKFTINAPSDSGFDLVLTLTIAYE